MAGGSFLVSWHPQPSKVSLSYEAALEKWSQSEGSCSITGERCPNLTWDDLILGAGGRRARGSVGVLVSSTHPCYPRAIGTCKQAQSLFRCIDVAGASARFTMGLLNCISRAHITKHSGRCVLQGVMGPLQSML